MDNAENSNGDWRSWSLRLFIYFRRFDYRRHILDTAENSNGDWCSWSLHLFIFFVGLIIVGSCCRFVCSYYVCSLRIANCGKRESGRARFLRNGS